MARKSQNQIPTIFPNPHKFNRGDTVQWIRDTRYVGRVLLPGKTASVRWIDGADASVPKDELILFTDLVKGEQKVYGSYFFCPGDLVKCTAKNHKKKIFTIVECCPSGIVRVDDDGEIRTLYSTQLQLIKRPAPIEGELVNV